jgi:aryl carrier-like protein
VHQQRPQQKQDAAEVQAAVAQVVAGVLGTAVDPAQPLMEAGLDSIGMCRPDASI